MSHQVTIRPSNHVFSVREDETILDAALREGHVIAYGCRNGACGTCKGTIVQGNVDYGTHQQSALTEAEKRLGLALFCRAKPCTDLVVETREVSAVNGIQIKTLPCRVQKMDRVAPDVMVIHLKLPASERLQFLAGQYVDILMKDGSRRSLSMANAPHDDDFLQLHLRNYGGPFSRHVFNTMKVRDILRFEGPLGTFFLRDDSEKPILLLASGTGFAPIKALVEHALHLKSRRPMVMYWGARVRADLYMNDLPEAWAKSHPDFKYVPVLSEPLATDNWTGRTGLVHHAVMHDIPDLSSYQVYACGAPVMVESAHRDFTTRCKLPEDEFYSDAFTPAAPTA
ncbi:MAG: CDP-6-deoxy-delta-3,4-glucoseen reductase [Betaproteobacteria bacterium]|nr:CDP-6-deoxy-delta-3,4-glucoseen reductase [Betaproteobacteria bacterium]